MTLEQKRQIREALVRYMENYNTPADAAATLSDISLSTISLISNHNWELLSDRLWHHVARQVGFYCGEWQAADTSAHLLLRILFADAQHYAMTYGIAMSHGLGKTFTALHYTRQHENVVYVAGTGAHNRRSFLQALLAAAGKSPEAATTGMLQQLLGTIKEMNQPVLVIDDAHKLKDRVLLLVVLLANSLAGNAGVIIMGDDSLRMRIIDGVRLKKAGYSDIYKIIGRRFISLSSLSPADVATVCRANGLHDEDVIDYITQSSNNNLHTATSLIVAHTQQSIAA